MHIQKAQHQGGFTLVELAVVLLIIGLIVGGILRGQELVTSAQLNSVQTDANQIRLGVNTFRDKFLALPGDYSTPVDAIDGDNLNGTGGDGDGLIEGNREGNVNTDGNETAGAWVHLAKSDLISGVDAEALAGGDQVDSSNALPGSLGGFWTIGSGLLDLAQDGTFDNNGGNFGDTASASNIWLVLGKEGSIATGANNDGPIVSAEEAAQLDRKIDDGGPDSGTMRATSSCSDGSSPASYTIDGSSNCALGLQL